MRTSPGPVRDDRTTAPLRRRVGARLIAPGVLTVAVVVGALVVPAGAASNQRVSVVTIPGLGKVLAVGHHVLYVHRGDSKRHSTCTGGCAVAWPPFLVSARTAHHLGTVRGLGTFKRSKGHLQVTIDGHPLYFFAGDATLRSAKGQGFANVFFTVRPNGTAVTVPRGGAGAAPAAPAPTSTTSTSTSSTSTSPSTQPHSGSVPTSPPPTSPPPTSPRPTSPPPTSPPPTIPPTTTTSPPPTTTTTAPSGGGVSF